MSEIGGDVSTVIVRVSTDLSREAAKMTNESVKQLLLYMIQKAKEQSDRAGEVALKKLVKSNDEIKMFDLEQKQLKAFNELAKKYEISYAVVEDQKRFSVFYKQNDENRVKLVLEKLLEQGLGKDNSNIPVTKIDDKEQGGLMLVQQKLFAAKSEKSEAVETGKLSPDEIKQLMSKREDTKPPYEVVEPKGKIEMTFVVDRNGSYERIGLNQLDERVKRILEHMKDNEKHHFDVGSKGDRISVERQGNVFIFRAEQSKEQERTNGRVTLAAKLGKPENEFSIVKGTPGERLSLTERRQEIMPLVEAQKQAPPVKNKNRERGGR